VEEADQLIDEERIAGRLARDRGGQRAAAGAVAAQPDEGQLSRLVRRQDADLHLAHFHRRRPRRAQALDQVAHRLAGVGVLAAIGQDQEQRRRVGRAQEIDQQHAGVEVAPLHVVDDQDERVAGGHAGEQLAQRVQPAPPELVRVGRRDPLRRRLDHLGAAQDREEPRHRQDVARQERLHLLAREPGQVAAERVDQAVERLVRHRLALVAAPGQHHRAALLGQLARDPLDQHALAHAGAAVHQHGHRLPVAHRGGERLAQHLRVRAPAHQRRRVLRARPRRAARNGRRGQAAAQPAQDRLTVGARGRIAVQEVDAQLRQVDRRLRHQVERRHRLAPLLLHQHHDRRADERQGAGQRVVEHGADRVPVAGRPQLQRCALLGRHVVDRADHVVVVGHAAARARQVGDEAEVEQHDAPVAVDHHVGWLDVAVQLAGLVEDVHALGQLAQRVAQPVVRQRRRRGRLVERHRRGVGARARLGGEARHQRTGAGVGPAIRLGVVEAERAKPRLRSAPNPGDEVHPLDQLHREEPLVAGRDQLVQRGQVGMADVGQLAELALELVEGGGVAVAQGLERHGAGALAVVGLIHDAHPAGAEAPDELEPVAPCELSVETGRHPLAFPRSPPCPRGRRDQRTRGRLD
jgi:hypothetical protein